MHTYPPWQKPVGETAPGEIVTHEAIAHRAAQIWAEQDHPDNQDLALWLEAEAQLHATAHRIYRHPVITPSFYHISR